MRTFLVLAVFVFLALPGWAQETPVPAAIEPVVTTTPVESAPAGSVWNSFFPEGLIDANDQPVSVDVLQNKIVGIYFSAHWCPPCRAFSPKLVEFRNQNQGDFEVAFVSHDKTAPAQLTYMQEFKMPWPAVKWDTEPANLLKTKYQVSSIPTLVILTPKGTLITKDGRGDVLKNPNGCLAEWKKAAGQ